MVKGEKCYLCGQNTSNILFIKLGYKIYNCRNCGLFSLKTKEEYSVFLKSYYKEGYFKGDQSYRAYVDYEGDKPVIQRNMDSCLNKIMLFKQKGKILDIGCATGVFLEEAEKRGFDPYGIDVSKYATTIAKKKFGDRIVNSPLSKAKYKDNFFNIVSMLDLIEHLADPKEDLLKIKSWLKSDGILVIQTGDLGSIWSKILGKNWHFFAPPQHLFFFSQKTLSLLLNKAGFKIMKIQKEGKWVSLRYLFYMMGYVGGDGIGNFFYNLVRNNFIGEIPVFLRFNDNMVVFAQKT